MARSPIIKHWIPERQDYLVLTAPSASERRQATSIVSAAMLRAESILAEARAEADALIREAQEQRSVTFEATKQTAIAEARREVEHQLRSEMDQTFSRFREIVSQAELAEQEIRNARYADLLALAVAVAERVIEREIQTDQATVERLVDTALSQSQLDRVTQIAVHPEDVEVVQRWAASALAEAVAHIEIVADPHVGRGGCVVGTRTGFVDARIESRLEEIRRTLTEVIGDG